MEINDIRRPPCICCTRGRSWPHDKLQSFPKYSDARYLEMPDDNIPSQKYHDTGIPRYFLVDVNFELLLLCNINK